MVFLDLPGWWALGERDGVIQPAIEYDDTHIQVEMLLKQRGLVLLASMWSASCLSVPQPK